MSDAIQTQPKPPAQFSEAAYMDALNLERYLLDQEPLPVEATEFYHPRHPEYVAATARMANEQRMLAAREYNMKFTKPPGHEMRAYGDVFASRMYSPLAWTALHGIEHPGYAGTRLEAADRIEAIRSVDGLVCLADRFIARNDRTVVTNLPLFAKTTGADRVEAHLDYIADKRPSNVFIYLDKIKQYVDQDRVEQIIRTAADSQMRQEDSYLSKSNLLNQDTLPVLSSEQITGIASGLLRQTFSYGENYRSSGSAEPPSSDALDMLHAGYVDEKQVLDGLIAIPQKHYVGNNFTAGLPLYTDMLERHGRVEELRGALEKGVGGGMVTVDDVPRLPYFSDEEKRGLMAMRLHRSPENVLQDSMEPLLTHLPAEMVRGEFETAAPGMSANGLAMILEKMPDTVLTKDEKAEHLRGAAIFSPEGLTEHLELIVDLFDEQEARQIIATVVEKAELPRHSMMLEQAGMWLPMMGGPEQQQTALRGLLERSENPGFLAEYATNETMQKLLPPDELRQLLIDRITGTDKPLVPELYDEDEKLAFDAIMGTDPSTVPDLAWRSVDRNPAATLELAYSMSERLTSEQRHDLVWAVARNNPLLVLQTGESALMVLTAGEQAQTITASMAASPGETVSYVSYAAAGDHMTPQEAQGYLLQVARENPALLYLFDLNEAMWTKAEALEQMRSNENLRTIAPEWFAELFEDFARANESSKEILMKEAAQMYENIATVRRFAPELLDSVTVVASNARGQRDALVKLAYVAEYGDPRDVHQFAENVSLAELSDVTFRTLELELGVALTRDARSQLEPALVPYTVYLKHFGDSEGHRRILTEFAGADGPEAFRDFRLIANTPEALAHAKADGLLPEKLTLEQHAVWREDEEILSHESLKASAEDIADRVRTVVRSAVAEAGLAVPGGDLNTVSTLVLGQEIAALGSRLAEVRRMHLVNPMMTREERIEQDRLVLQAQSALAKKQVLMAAVRLHSLSTQEITSGKFINSTGKQMQPFHTVLDRAQKAAAVSGLPPEAGMMLSEIGMVLRDYQQRTAEARDVSVTDTIDQQTTLEVGAKPVGSCQDYATGEYRECLLGYTEPNTKIIRVQDNGTIIARAIFRLGEDDDGNVALHVERTYSQSASPVVFERSMELAYRKADKMGVPVYITPFAQEEVGQLNELALPEGIRAVPEYKRLRVRGIRAPYVYVDSGDGSVQGEYRVMGAARLERAA